MRRISAFLLLASAAVPALADPGDERDGNRERVRAERSERAAQDDDAGPRQGNRGERAARPDAPDRPVRNAGARSGASDSGNRPARGQEVERAPVADRAAPAERRQGAGETVRNLRQGRSGDTVRNWRSNERRRVDSPATIEERNFERDTRAVDSSGAGRSIEERNVRRLGRTARGGPLVREVPTTGGITDRGLRRIGNVQPVEGAQAPPPATASSDAARTAHRWRTDWRRDRRYDWHNWRKRNRSRFHFGFYFDPFGWNYRRLGIGWRMWPSYYSSRYWLNDPWHYRLPPAYGPYRWIRYHNDALLVNIYTGHVVDVVYNFFW